MKDELRLIKLALESDRITKQCPIAHLIPRTPDSEAWGDSSLDAAGGFSTDMGFWWYLEWPQNIRARTLQHITSSTSGPLIDINCLEYATILINFGPCTHFWCAANNRETKGITYPTCLLWADNTTAEAWTQKGCKKSPVGRSLGRLQCTLMLNNPMGIATGHISTHDNVIADRISRHKLETNTLLHFNQLIQEFPLLTTCQRFHPSPMLLSAIMDSLLSASMIDPLTTNEHVLSNPGKIVTSGTVAP